MIRKILLFSVIALLLQAVGASAGQSPRLDSLRVYSFDFALLPVAGNRTVTTAIGNRVVNTAIQQVCTDFPALEKLDTVTLSSGMEGATLNSDMVSVVAVEYILPIENEHGDADTVRMYVPPIAVNDLRLKFPTSTSVVQNKSGQYDPKFWYVEAKKLKFAPKWIRGDTASFVVTYLAMDTLLTTDSSSTSVETQFLNAVKYYAASLLFTIQQDAFWAKYYRDLYNIELAKYRGVPANAQ